MTFINRTLVTLVATYALLLRCHLTFRTLVIIVYNLYPWGYLRPGDQTFRTKVTLVYNQGPVDLCWYLGPWRLGPWFQTEAWLWEGEGQVPSSWQVGKVSCRLVQKKLIRNRDGRRPGPAGSRIFLSDCVADPVVISRILVDIKYQGRKSEPGCAENKKLKYLIQIFAFYSHKPFGQGIRATLYFLGWRKKRSCARRRKKKRPRKTKRRRRPKRPTQRRKERG